MAISRYWVGQIPNRPISIEVRDSIGNTMNLSTYTFNVLLMDPDNNLVDTTGSTLNTAGAASGQFVFRFPTDRSLFLQPGEYLLQLEIDGTSGTKDFTTAHHIRVNKLGGNN